MKKAFTKLLFLLAVSGLAIGPIAAQKAAQKALRSHGVARANSEMAKTVREAGPASARVQIQQEKKTSSRGLSNAFQRGAAMGYKPFMKSRAMAGDATLPTLYGSVVFSDDVYLSPGLYDLPLADGENFNLLIKGARASYGGVLKDGVYYATSYNQETTAVTGYDVATGQIVYTFSVDETVGPVIAMGLDLDPVTDDIYGIVYREDLSGYMLAKIIYNKTPDVTKIADLSGTWNTFMIDGEGQFYGIRKEYQVIDGSQYLSGSTLCKINRETGAVTEVGPTGKYPVYLSDGCFDRSTGRIFWAVSDNDSGFLCEVNPATGDARTIYTFPNGEEVCGMYVPTALAADKAPAAVQNLKAVFNEGSLQGQVTCKAPSTLFDGAEATGNMTLHLMVNGVEKASQTAAYGALVTFPVTLPEAGFYNFIVYAENAAGKGPKTKVDDLYYGKDTPVATTVTLTEDNNTMTVSWLPVTATVNDGYLNPDEVVYNVYRYPGAVEVAKGISETTFTETLETPESQTPFYYGVVVEYAGLLSQEAYSNSISLGTIVPPYQSDFSQPTGFTGFTIINANNDDYTWELNLDYGYARIRWNSSIAMDDWLITPPIRLKAGESYEISFDALSSSVANVERLEVYWGAAPTVEGMTNLAVGPTDINNGGLSAPPMVISSYISPAEDGIYYVGIHGISPKDKSALWVGDIKISAPMSAFLPGTATDLKVVPDPDGKLEAELSFKAPAVTMGNAPLESITKIEVTNSTGETVHTFDNPTPGETLSCTVTEEAGGNYSYEVTAFNSYGAGVAASISSHIGLDRPATPSNFEIASTANVGEVNLTWDTVDTDINGNAINPDKVTYIVCRVSGGEQQEIVSGLTTTSYTFQAVEAGKQEFVQCAVFAVTDGGTGSGAVSEMIPVGTPYDGLSESFAGGTISYIWGVNTTGGASWSVYNDRASMSSQDSDNGFLALEAAQAGDNAYIFSGLVSLENMDNPGFTFYTFNMMGEAGTPDENIIRVSIREDGGEYTEVLGETVQTLCNETSGWNKVTVALGAYEGKVIQVKIEGEATNFAYILFDNLRIGSMLQNDLKALNITAPASVNTGEAFKVNVTVQNNGLEAATDYTVALYADGVKVESKAGGQLAPEGRVAVSFDQTMSPIATAPVSYYAVVEFDLDGNPLDNQTATVTVEPRQSSLPAVNDLEASVVNAAVQLSWSEPSSSYIKGQPHTDDFEDADAFASRYGSWIFVDVDNSPVGGFEQTDVPGITPGVTKGSFWIWDQALLGNETYHAHSGTKFLFALYRADSKRSDDWAISPVLDGQAQTVSFYARSYDSTYPEYIEVYYSTGSTDVNNFIKIDGVGGEVPEEWTLYEVSLPEGAKRFAIRSCAEDSFMLLVDDVTYIPEVSDDNYEIMGYNVYRDGVKLNSEPVEENEYTDEDVVSGKTYSYIVTTVYTQGESTGSNEVTVLYTASSVDSMDAAGLRILVNGNTIEVVNPEMMPVIISGADGMAVVNAEGRDYVSAEVNAGIYVIKAGETVRKVIIK